MVVWEASRLTETSQTIVESTLRATSPIPLWLSIVVVLAIVVFVGWIYARERGQSKPWLRVVLAALRASCLLILIWMLFGWSLLQYRTSRPELIVVVDRSDSMLTADASQDQGVKSRLDAAIDELAQTNRRMARKLAEDYATRWFWIADGVHEHSSKWGEPIVQPEPGSLTTNTSQLGDALARIVARQSGSGTAGIIFLSDGINTSGQGLADAGQQARSEAIPIYSMVFGQSTGLPDIRVADVLYESDMYLGDVGVVDASIALTNVSEAQCSVELVDRVTGSVLDRQEVVVDNSVGQVPVRLRYTPDSIGQRQLLVRIDALSGEVDLENNSSQIDINVQDRTIRVLLVFRRPSYEYRFLKHWLERSRQESQQAAAFEVDCVLQDGASVGVIPTSKQEISKYDAFVFGDFDPQLASRSSLEAIRNAVVNQGAGCLFVFGRDEPSETFSESSLANLLPVRLRRGGLGASQSIATQSSGIQYSWKATKLGGEAPPMQLATTPSASAKVWSKVPRISSLAEVEELLPSAQVLSVAYSGLAEPPRPLLVTGFAGGGRTAVQLTDESYFLISVGGDDQYYQKYWGQTLRWLTRGRLARDSAADLRIQPVRSRFGEPVRFSLFAGQESGQLSEVPLVLSSEDHEDRSVRLVRSPRAPRILQAVVDDLQPGRYTAVWQDPESQQSVEEEFVVSSPPSERANLKSDREALRKLAEKSRGKFYEQGQINQLLSDLPRGRRAKLGELPPKPVWNSPWIALLLLSLLSTEWILRRRARML